MCEYEGDQCELSDGSLGVCKKNMCCPAAATYEPRMCAYEGAQCELSDGSPGICKKGYWCPDQK